MLHFYASLNPKQTCQRLLPLSNSHRIMCFLTFCVLARSYWRNLASIAVTWNCRKTVANTLTCQSRCYVLKSPWRWGCLNKLIYASQVDSTMGISKSSWKLMAGGKYHLHHPSSGYWSIYRLGPAKYTQFFWRHEKSLLLDLILYTVQQLYVTLQSNSEWKTHIYVTASHILSSEVNSMSQGYI